MKLAVAVMPFATMACIYVVCLMRRDVRRGK